MNIINVENITKSYAERKLFSEASFYVQENEKIGIVGVNGTGKTTLLRIIAGTEEPEEGSITKANHLVINYLSQNPQFEDEKSVLENVMKQVITTDLDEAHRWTMESEAKELLLRFGISDFTQPVKELSGGQKMRVAVASTILKPCDVLILDEPTNHLDYDMIEWLESFLRGFRGAIVMVTHDRFFLDCVCNRIVEIDKGAIYSYDTNYSGFLERKAAREESAIASERKRQSILRKEIEWMQRGARARSTKQKAHIQRYEKLRDQKGPQIDEKLELSSVYTRMGRSTIEIKDVSKSYGDIVCVKDFSYHFLKNDRVGFVGKNGCGKSTLMKLIAGEEQPDFGTIEIGQTVKIGYFSQEMPLVTEGRAIDYIKDVAEYVRTEDGLVSASAMLERFLFTGEKQYCPVSKLSGGERRRLNLLRILMEAPNVLVLDEPTNELDTETLAILEDYLDNYEGIVITVSHDRYFLDRVVRRIFAFEEDGSLRQYEGGYSDYLEKRPEPTGGMEVTLKTEKEAPKVDSKETWTHTKKVKFTYQEQKEYETIEADIEELEEKISKLEAEILKNSRDFVKLNELTKEKDATEELLMEKMERWEYLEEKSKEIGKTI